MNFLREKFGSFQSPHLAGLNTKAGVDEEKYLKGKLIFYVDLDPIFHLINLNLDKFIANKNVFMF